MVTPEPEELEKLGAPSIRVFFQLSKVWSLSVGEQAQILKTEVQILEEWRRRAAAHKSVPLDLDTITRLGALFGIFRSLELLFRDDELRVAWLRTPNSGLVFNGRSAIDLMTSSDDGGLYDVYNYLRSKVL